MPKLILADAFREKSGALEVARDMKRIGVQYVTIRKLKRPLPRYGIFVGGRGSQRFKK